MKYEYDTKYTCSRKIYFDINDGIVTNVSFIGGCNGNLKAISSLVNGLSVDEITDRLEGIKCGMKPTSCSDQLVKAVKEAYKKENEMKSK